MVGTIRDLGALGALIIALAAGYKGYWVWGRHYDAMEKDRDYWRARAEEAAKYADRLTKLEEAEQRRQLNP